MHTSVPQPSPWDHTVLDPRLISSQSSELAGALTLPSQATSNTSSASTGRISGRSSGIILSLSSRATSGTDPDDADAPYVPENNEGASSSRSRFCSVKGCKTMLSADHFFKMCEPCRDRYRGYGITKRAKWRAERVAVNTELEALRIEEDKRRAEEDLPVCLMGCLFSASLTKNSAVSLWPRAPKTGLPGKMTSSKGLSSLKPNINTVLSPRVCALFRTVVPFYQDITNIDAASSIGCKTDTIAN